MVDLERTLTVIGYANKIKATDTTLYVGKIDEIRNSLLKNVQADKLADKIVHSLISVRNPSPTMILADSIDSSAIILNFSQEDLDRTSPEDFARYLAKGRNFFFGVNPYSHASSVEESEDLKEHYMNWFLDKIGIKAKHMCLGDIRAYNKLLEDARVYKVTHGEYPDVSKLVAELESEQVILYSSFLKLGDMAKQRNDIESTLLEYDKAIQILPEHCVEAWNKKAQVYLNQKKHTDALGCFEQVLRLNPDEEFARNHHKRIKKNIIKAEPYYLKGLQLLKRGKYRRATWKFNKSLKLSPDWTEAIESRTKAQTNLEDILMEKRMRRREKWERRGDWWYNFTHNTKRFPNDYSKPCSENFFDLQLSAGLGLMAFGIMTHSELIDIVGGETAAAVTSLIASTSYYYSSKVEWINRIFRIEPGEYYRSGVYAGGLMGLTFGALTAFGMLGGPEPFTQAGVTSLMSGMGLAAGLVLGLPTKY